jgi:hypothetical protein
MAPVVWHYGLCARRTTVEAKQHCSVIGWVTKNVLSPPSFGRHVKRLVAAVFVVVRTHQSALGPRGELWPVLVGYS